MKLRHILLGVTPTLLLFSCQENAYLGDVYVKPEARFTTEKSTYEVFESVVFTNAGSGQNYVVYTGDPGHVYGEPGPETKPQCFLPACHPAGNFRGSILFPGQAQRREHLPETDRCHAQFNGRKRANRNEIHSRGTAKSP